MSDRWSEQARCLGHPDPDLWHPIGGGSSGQVASAKSICGGCPVWRPCLEVALIRDETGIWGNTTHEERRNMIRNERAARLRTAT